MGYLDELIIPIVLAACLAIGFCIKSTGGKTVKKWIPTIMAATGAVLGCLALNEASLQAAVSGAVTGLASTGLYEAFAQWIRKDDQGEDQEGRINNE